MLNFSRRVIILRKSEDLVFDGFHSIPKKKKMSQAEFFSLSLLSPGTLCWGGGKEALLYRWISINPVFLFRWFLYLISIKCSFETYCALHWDVHIIILVHPRLVVFFFTINPRFCLRYSVGKTACQSERCNLSNFRAIDAHLKTAPTKFVHI